MSKLLAIIGFIVLGLSPSFVDWEQTADNPNLRRQMIAFYAIGILFIYFGLDGWAKGG